MSIEEYFGDWSKVIDLKEADSIARRLSRIPGICPLPKDIFKAFHLCPLEKLRVVLIGQDPYPTVCSDGSPVATGLAFANRMETPESSFSPSLIVLRKSLIDFSVPHESINFDPSLEKWEKQGVLLLNTALTCLQGRPSSHTLMWRPFMKSLLTNLSEHATGIVYILMGSDAKSLEPYISKQFNYVIHIRHPSYYARTREQMPRDWWQQANKILTGQNGYGIKWYE